MEELPFGVGVRIEQRVAEIDPLLGQGNQFAL